MKQKIKQSFKELYAMLELNDMIELDLTSVNPSYYENPLMSLFPKSDYFVKKVEQINEFIYGTITHDIEKALASENNKFLRTCVSNANYINHMLINIMLKRDELLKGIGDEEENRVAIHDYIDSIIKKIEEVL